MKFLSTCILALFATTLSVVAQHGETAAQDPAAVHAERSTMKMPDAVFFTDQFHHLVPAVVARPQISPNPAVNEWFVFYNVNLYQVFVVVGITLLFGLVGLSFRSGRAPWLIRVFRGWCHWLRDEVVYNVMGKEQGERWAPLFLYMFFFVAFLNLVGMVPGSVTATACVFVTGALAAVTFVSMVVGGMIVQGPIAFWKHLLPPGLPAALIPLMAFVEVVGLLVRPFALMIRLFANMLAGHLLIYSFVGLIFVFAKMFDLSALSWATAIPSIGMAVFINIVEALVVLLQAYIFTYLSALFIQQCLHPEH